SALPLARGPLLGMTIDAPLTDSAAAPAPFDDGNGHGAATPDGAFTLGARQTETVVSATVRRRLPADQLVQAVIDSTGSTALDDGFGVVCRWQSNDSYYRLGIGNDGTYGIARVEHGTSTVLSGGGQWVRDRNLSRSPGLHTIGGECRGNTLTLFADNVPIA